LDHQGRGKKSQRGGGRLGKPERVFEKEPPGTLGKLGGEKKRPAPKKCKREKSQTREGPRPKLIFLKNTKKQEVEKKRMGRGAGKKKKS